MNEILLDGFSLTRAQVVRAARRRDGSYAQASLSREAAERCARQRSFVETEWLSGVDQKAIYGFNTGVGILKDKQVRASRLEEFQTYYIRSHCVGVGESFDDDTVRAAILIRANSLASGFSGVRPDLLTALLSLLAREIHPIVPRVGSLGASGDLAPLAHVGAVITGEPEARVRYQGQVVRLADLPTGAGLSCIQLAPKEAMALTNGTSFMLADLTLLTADAQRLQKVADIAAALSLEAMLGEICAFDPRLQAVRGHPGQEATARNIRRLLEGGESTGESLRLEYLRKKVEHEVAQTGPKVREAGLAPESLEAYRVATEHVPRVQDAYSLRCVPQVHGASRDALEHVIEVVARELNAVTDNPLLFPEGDGFVAISGGNFHGQPLALAADYAALALAELGSISERRLFRLLNSNLSYGLPSNLTGGEPGINTGLMISQYTAAALVTESKTLSHPASVDSIPTSGDQEDHVSMGLWASRKARQVLENSRRVLAIEILAAAQGVDLMERTLGRARTLGRGARAAYDVLRQSGIPVLEEDRYLETDLEAVDRILGSDALIHAVETTLGSELE
ncbi:MAG: aromatic amino acid lyase [Candidatus Eisenbacteria bacterium]|uniref:Aromatic amino acid lyase n=1 Tax=Eiseniibacteriota bacterium TaxID=2212470 RepID=A0A956LVW8_UNCEI|nr:aromatic amino acid lyase [Candidatus Eisenbacteria bacterium]